MDCNDGALLSSRAARRVSSGPESRLRVASLASLKDHVQPYIAQSIQRQAMLLLALRVHGPDGMGCVPTLRDVGCWRVIWTRIQRSSTVPMSRSSETVCLHQPRGSCNTLPAFSVRCVSHTTMYCSLTLGLNIISHGGTHHYLA